MRIQLSKKTPPIRELAEILRHSFSNLYSVETFGIGQKSILVGKSTLVGAEVTVHENEVSIASSPPSIFGGVLLALGLTELAIFLLPFLFKESLSVNSSYRALEKEVGYFLKRRFA